jgi:hypothetical protein
VVGTEFGNYLNLRAELMSRYPSSPRDESFGGRDGKFYDRAVRVLSGGKIL